MHWKYKWIVFMLRRKSIRPLRMFFMSCLSSIFSQWVPLPNPRFIDLEWYKNIFGNNNTNYIKATYTADNTVNLHSKNCNFLLSRSLLFSICCSLILENGNFYTYNDKFINIEMRADFGSIGWGSCYVNILVILLP